MLTLLTLSLPAQAGFETSSQKQDSRYGNNAFGAVAAFDSDPKTCWQSNPEKDNKGQWIGLDIPVSTVDKIAMRIGWDKSEEAFKDHGRVKSAKVVFFDKGLGDPKQKGEAKVAYEDKQGWQYFDIEDIKIEGELGGSMRLTVDEFYPGVDFPNLAVSEIRVHLKEFPAETIAVSSLGGADDAQVPESLVDKNARSIVTFKEQKGSMMVGANGYGMSTVGVEAGPKTHARPKTVVVKADGTETRHTIDEKATGMQWLLIPAIIGYTGSAAGEIEVVIEDSWPGSVPTNPLALSEVRLNATVIEEF